MLSQISACVQIDRIAKLSDGNFFNPCISLEELQSLHIMILNVDRVTSVHAH